MRIFPSPKNSIMRGPGVQEGVFFGVCRLPVVRPFCSTLIFLSAVRITSFSVRHIFLMLIVPLLIIAFVCPCQNLKSLSFGDILWHHQNLWEVPANVDNFFVLFATNHYKVIMPEVFLLKLKISKRGKFCQKIEPLFACTKAKYFK